MLLGQAKIVRYYPYYLRFVDTHDVLLCCLVICGQPLIVLAYFLLHDRTLEAAKTIMLDLKYVNNAEDRAIFLTDIEKLKKVSCTRICFECHECTTISIFLLHVKFWLICLLEVKQTNCLLVV